jgi:hypothetical protein
MKTKFIVTTIVLAIPAFLLGRMIWPDVPGAMAPLGIQLPLFMFISALEAVAFGIGVSFVIYGWSLVKRVMPADAHGAKLVFVSIAWLLVSWWPHDNMHRANGMDMAGLLRIEYIFHLTLIVASAIVAYYFWKYLERSAGAM